VVEDRLQLDLLVDVPEVVDALLEPFGDGRSQGSMMSRPFALAVACPMVSRS
jgi:hypothetical protein